MIVNRGRITELTLNILQRYVLNLDNRIHFIKCNLFTEKLNRLIGTGVLGLTVLTHFPRRALKTTQTQIITVVVGEMISTGTM